MESNNTFLVNIRTALGGTFVFSTYGILFFVSGMGWLGDNCGLTLGIIQVCLGGLFILNAFEAMKINPAGNMQLIFGFCFGLWGGTSNILMGLGIPLDGYTVGWMNIIAGFMLLITVPGYIYDPWPVPVIEILAGIGVFIMGLAGLGIAANLLNWLGAVLFGICGVLGLYLFTAYFNNAVGGHNMPYGKPFFTRKISEPNIK